MALVLAETAAGGAGILFLTPLWGEVRRGFFYLTGGIVFVLALSAAGAAAGAYDAATASKGRVAVITGAIGAPSHPGRASSTLNPLLTVAGSATWIAIGMVACTGLIAVFIRITLRGTRPTAVQSATGFFYLAVITAFTAELAAKVRFLP